MSINYYICDTETTGLSKDMHEIVEMSVIRVADKVQLSRQIKAEHPNNASLDALKITNKTISDLLEGVSKEQAVKDFNNFFAQDGSSPEHRCIIFHNAPFDIKFIQALWNKCNSIFPCNLSADTMTLMRAWKKKNNLDIKVNLKDSLDALKIEKRSGFHNAAGDTRNTYRLWMKLKEEVNYIPMIKRAFNINTSTDDDEDD